jgi:hypothetical protein
MRGKLTRDSRSHRGDQRALESRAQLRLAAMGFGGLDQAADLAEIGQRDGIDPSLRLSSMAVTILASAALES